MKVNKLLITSWFIIFSLASNAQDKKIEKEERIKRGEVPEQALNWFRDSYERARKVKWYLEESNQGKSYEAKLKWKDHWHSVEFDAKGLIEDIEVQITWEQIPADVRENLDTYLTSNYQKYRIRKIQRQWTGLPEELEDAIDEGEEEEVKTRYEIIYYGKTETEKELWEGLFDVSGHLVNKRIVKLRPTDNLNF